MDKYEFKGTPGQWSFRQLFDKPIKSEDGNYEHIDSLLFSGDKYLADVKYCTLEGAKAGYPRVDNLEEFNANTHLIAAAPNLLKACLDMVDTIDEMGGNNTLEPVCDFMRSAIHKATN